MEVQTRLEIINAVVANGQTKSAAIYTGGVAPAGIYWPTITSTACTLEASHDGTTFVPVKVVGGSTYSLTVASATYTAIDPTTLCGMNYLKLVMGSAEGAERTIPVAFAPA